MPVTERAKAFMLTLYAECGLDRTCQVDALAADAAQRRHGQRITLRDVRIALREVIAEREAWGWTDMVVA